MTRRRILFTALATSLAATGCAAGGRGGQGQPTLLTVSSASPAPSTSNPSTVATTIESSTTATPAAPSGDPTAASTGADPVAPGLSVSPTSVSDSTATTSGDTSPADAATAPAPAVPAAPPAEATSPATTPYPVDVENPAGGGGGIPVPGAETPPTFEMPEEDTTEADAYAAAEQAAEDERQQAENLAEEPGEID